MGMFSQSNQIYRVAKDKSEYFRSLSTENRYIREIICSKDREIRYWQITTDIEVLAKNTTWYVMSKYPEITQA